MLAQQGIQLSQNTGATPEAMTALGEAEKAFREIIAARSDLTAGVHAISAVYTNDTNFASSTSSSLSYTITRYPVGIAVSPSANPAQYGATVGFTVRVDATTGAAPTGTVSLVDAAAGDGGDEEDLAHDRLGDRHLGRAVGIGDREDPQTALRVGEV